jgi:plastocyanin
MTRIRLAAVAALATAALALGASAQAATPTLTATVGPGFNITLTKAGKRVTTLKPGLYRIVVRDRSDEHNFRLRGLGVSKATSVDAVTSATWTVRLRVGRYTYVCDPHADAMRGSFRVAR